MNTAKPSIPSSNGGAADDLIEELARLMAESAQENSSDAPPPEKTRLTAANSPAQQPDRQTPSRYGLKQAGDKAGLTRFASGKKTDSPPLAAPAAKPASKLESAAPKPGQPGKPDKTGSGYGSGMGINRDPAAKPVGAGLSAPDPSPGRPASALSAPSSVAPVSSGASQVSSAVSQVSSAVSQVSSPETGDPIADLIRAQSTLENDPATDGQGRRDENHAASAAPDVATNNDPATEPRNEPQYARPQHTKRQDTDPSHEKAGLKKGDKFRVPPVFGLSGKPSAPPASDLPPVAPVAPAVAKQAPAAKTGIGKTSGGLDALDEIENLIGNAVRVDFPKESGSGKSTPQVRKETPPQAIPQDSPQDKPQDKIDSAEDAILQAMAAVGKFAQEKQEKLESGVKPSSSGASPDIFVDESFERKPSENDDLLAGEQSVAPAKTGRRASRFLVPFGAGVVLIGAILGGYWVLTSGADNGDAPVLVADSAPGKQAPPQGQENSGGQSGQFSDVAGKSGVNANADPNASANSNAPANERLVSRDQSTDIIGNEIRRVITADTTETGLANRRVRTVTVRPDGTIISGDAAVAGGQVLPVARPNVPQLPANTLNPELTNTTVAALPNSSADGDALSENNASLENEAPKLTLTTRVDFPATGTMVAPIPRPRPVNRAALAATNNSGTLDLIGTTTTPAPTPPAPIASPAPVAATGATSTLSKPLAWVQMASRRSRDAANQSAASLQTKYASIFGSAKLEVQRIDLGDRGIFYRVLLPAATLDEASAVCNSIKSAGGDCFTRNN